MDKLNKTQWLDHGLETLAQSGFTALKADKLVKTLGVSRGSFYWHFKNLADFHESLLKRWQDVMVHNIIQELESQENSATTKLNQLISLAVTSDQSLEKAIRAWALNNPKVQTIANHIDQQRLEYIQSLLKSIGLNKDAALIRARVIYCGYLGQLMLSDSPSKSQKKALVDELIDIALKPS